MKISIYLDKDDSMLDEVLVCDFDLGRHFVPEGLEVDHGEWVSVEHFEEGLWSDSLGLLQDNWDRPLDATLFLRSEVELDLEAGEPRPHHGRDDTKQVEPGVAVPPISSHLHWKAGPTKRIVQPHLLSKSYIQRVASAV